MCVLCAWYNGTGLRCTLIHLWRTLIHLLLSHQLVTSLPWARNMLSFDVQTFKSLQKGVNLMWLKSLRSWIKVRQSTVHVSDDSSWHRIGVANFQRNRWSRQKQSRIPPSHATWDSWEVICIKVDFTTYLGFSSATAQILTIVNNWADSQYLSSAQFLSVFI